MCLLAVCAGEGHYLKVVEVRPDFACSLVGADVTVDFVEPSGGKPQTTYTLLDSGVSTSITLGAGDADYFTFISRDGRGVRVSAVTSYGDVNMYVSCKHTKPSRSRFEWSNTSSKADKSVDIAARDPHFPDADTSGRRVYYIALVGYAPSSSVTVAVTGSLEGPTDAPSSDGDGVVLGSVATNAGAGAGSGAGGSGAGAGAQHQGDTAASTESDHSVPAGYARCETCNELVPVMRIVMHSAFCQRNNAKCDVCKQVTWLSAECNPL